jgi:hypothetical protein
MTTVVRVVVGVLLLAHGLVHLLYLASDVPEFSLDSWAVPEGARRPLATVLMAATVVALAALALAVWGVPALASAWPVLAFVAAAASAILLVLFWDWHLVAGIAIDAALVVAAVARPSWLETFMTGGPS